MLWEGVMPAITTCFRSDLTIDHEFIAAHVRTLAAHGCTGIVALGSLGEGGTLEFDEKIALLKTCVAAVGDKIPVVAGVAALSTAQAVRLAQSAANAGCQGLMVLPPFVYRGDWPETRAHIAAVLHATALPCMLYNNPPAYGTDFLPAHVAELADAHANLTAVKESSGDVRRFAALCGALGARLALFVGLDDALVEGVAMGATGWVAGLVNAFPRESVALFDLARRGAMAEAMALYQWFLPLLRLDAVPKFVQLVKLVQQETGTGTAFVRPPRQMLAGAELADALAVIRTALASRPVV